jgi:hypothetical protein
VRTFGSDPELLVVKQGVPKSAIGVVQGSIENRISIKGHQFYYDNVLAECAIKPGKNKKEVLKHFKEALQIYADMVKPFELSPTACAEFPSWELEDKDARKVGCAPDYCAYEMKLKDPPKEAIESGNLRSCGGHVHLGSDLLAGEGPEPILAIYLLDLFVGVPSLWLDHDPSSSRRRAIYGQAGRYREKDYGIEYRSLGNFWLSGPELTGLIYDLCMFVQDFIQKGGGWDLWVFDEEVFWASENLADAWTCKGYNVEALKKGINTGSKFQVTDHYGIVRNLLPSKLIADLDDLAHRTEEGDFYKNWKLR